MGRAFGTGRPFGQIAFEAYNESKGGVTWDGKPIPPWDAVGEEVQRGWESAVTAVLVMGLELEEIDGYWCMEMVDGAWMRVCRAEGDR